MFAAKNELFTRPSGYQISRSVRLRSDASADLSRTPATASNKKTWTYSSWMKRGSLAQSYFFGTNFAGTGGLHSLQWHGNALFLYVETNAGVTKTGWETSAVFRDPSAWYHVVVVFDTTQAAVANMGKIYVNGILQTTTISNYSATYITQNADGLINGTTLHTIGSGRTVYTGYFDGYIAETNFIDGQALTPSSFGQYNANGVWSPIKYAGTYGTNGFYLNFSDNSASTATTIGKDYSGNANNWTPNNISVTAGVTYDSMLDVPTLYADGGNGRGNYCTLNPLTPHLVNTTLSSGNLIATKAAATSDPKIYGTIGVNSGKWYWEIKLAAQGGVGNYYAIIGVSNASLPIGTDSAAVFYFGTNDATYAGDKGVNGVYSNYGANYAAGDTIGVALDCDNLQITFYKNGASQGVISGLTAATYFARLSTDGTSNTATIEANFGQRPFTYTPPTGFVALNTQNLSTPTIANGAAYMAATTYTGTGASLTIANTVNSASFQPDFVWVKGRSVAYSHLLTDSVRGVSKRLVSDSTAAEVTDTATLTAFNSNGFSWGTGIGGNQNAATYVGWQWKAGGTSASNTSGTITSTVSVGATQGFSVVMWTGNGGTNVTVGHGLGVAPKMVITKNRSGISDWVVYHSSLTAGYTIFLSTTQAQSNASAWYGSNAPTSSVFYTTYPGNISINASANNYVSYCFSEVAGYSAFGSYTGNGSADGPFVYLGFRPRFIMIKRTDAVSNWTLRDTSRDTSNTSINDLYANSSNAESSAGANIDILSNGFKCRDAGGGATNASGGTYIYACFAENPFKYSLAR